jgi:hypothetical protein
MLCGVRGGECEIGFVTLSHRDFASVNAKSRQQFFGLDLQVDCREAKFPPPTCPLDNIADYSVRFPQKFVCPFNISLQEEVA